MTQHSAERDPQPYDRYRVDGRVWQIGVQRSCGRIEVLESPKDDDHPLRKTKLLLVYRNQLKKALKDAEVLHVA